ncbi:hypothetical protein FJZ40_04480, partial [Candidatus Shapirobacteria bacterium]|nr:hypothetical protein [Candidatus Shapirobacteria bacterium]
MKKSLLLGFCFLLLTTLSACGGLISGDKLIPGEPSPSPLGQACLDPATIGTQPVLKNIPKPSTDNTPFPNSG